MSNLLHEETRTSVDISSASEILSYEYPGETHRIAFVRVELGDNDEPIAGNGVYSTTTAVDGMDYAPVSNVQVAAGVTRAVLQSRPFVLGPGETLVIEATGLLADTAVTTTAVVIDATPATTSEIFGAGSVLVDHDYGGEDALRIVNPSSSGVDGALIRAFFADDYTAGNRGDAFVRGRTETGLDGRWQSPISLDPGEYRLVVTKLPSYQTQVHSLTVEA